MNASRKGNPVALLPILVFLLFYIGLSVVLNDFYAVPIVVAFLAAILTACLQNRKIPFEQKLKIMSHEWADENILTMILIFLSAGIFAGILGRDGASSAAYFLLDFIPARFSVAVLFVVAAFVSTAMGTSCGTITVIVPIAISVAQATGFSVPLCVGSVIGGAMFGDNLSFISDTTIAACNTQGCKMKDKFRENFFIALPAAVVTIALVLVLSGGQNAAENVHQPYRLWQLLPYVLVLCGGVAGLNVFVVLLAGIASATVVMLASGTGFAALLAQAGSGSSGMFETSMVALLVSALCGLMKEYGGFEAILSLIRRVFRGNKGGQVGVGLLVGAMDIATANNTVAIVMAAPIARTISAEYQITPRRTASLLDIFGCVLQGVLPYGAQMLLATAAIRAAGLNYTSVQLLPYLFYPYLLLASTLVSIFLVKAKNKETNV